MAYHPFRHIGLKLVSIGLALLLWWTVAGDPTVERNLRVPLQFQNMSESLQIVGEPPSGIDVRVRGASRTLSSLESGDVVAVLDLASARPGLRMFNVFKEHVRGPFGVTIEQVLTPTVPLELEQLVAHVVPIRPLIEGVPAQGFLVGAVTSEPGTVEILGPENRVSRITEAITEPVSVEGASESVQEVVTVGITDSTLQLQEAQTALVTVEIVAGPLERSMWRVPVVGKNLGTGRDVTLVPDVVNVTVRGERDLIDSLVVDTLSVSVNLEGLEPGEHRVPVEIATIERFEVVRADPSELVVRIR